MPTPIHRQVPYVLVVLCVALPGCGGFQTMKLPGIPTAEELQADTRVGHRRREQYQSTGDLQAVRWLLANRVRQGMSLNEVNRILGRDGKRVYEDSRYKSLNEGVRRTDETYQWDTAEEGVILFFRKERLVNHRGSQYEDASPTSFE